MEVWELYDMNDPTNSAYFTVENGGCVGVYNDGDGWYSAPWEGVMAWVSLQSDGSLKAYGGYQIRKIQ